MERETFFDWLGSDQWTDHELMLQPRRKGAFAWSSALNKVQRTRRLRASGIRGAPRMRAVHMCKSRSLPVVKIKSPSTGSNLVMSDQNLVRCGGQNKTLLGFNLTSNGCYDNEGKACAAALKKTLPNHPFTSVWIRLWLITLCVCVSWETNPQSVTVTKGNEANTIYSDLESPQLKLETKRKPAHPSWQRERPFSTTHTQILYFYGYIF